MKKLKSIYVISLALIMLFSVYQTRAIMTDSPATQEPGDSIECSQVTESPNQDSNNNLISTPGTEENDENDLDIEAITIKEIDQDSNNNLISTPGTEENDENDLDIEAITIKEIDEAVAIGGIGIGKLPPIDDGSDDEDQGSGLQAPGNGVIDAITIPGKIDEIGEIQNTRPTIEIEKDGVSVTEVSVSENHEITLEAIPSDEDNDPVSCEWTIPNDIVISNHGCSITITAPTVDRDEDYSLSVRALDRRHRQYSDAKIVVMHVLNIVESEGSIGGGNSMILPTPNQNNNIETIQPQVLGEKISAEEETDNTNKVETKKECFKFTKRLRAGYRDNKNNTEVSALQKLLKNFGLFKYPTITGYFGPITKQALKAFQKSKGLDQVGYIGPKTLQALNECDN